ncbi:MAG: M28 family peptidase [Gemmatimonadetes bacterium]|nr:M28 family peptidase [Gemmatimonadota bacterium]
MTPSSLIPIRARAVPSRAVVTLSSLAARVVGATGLCVLAACAARTPSGAPSTAVAPTAEELRRDLYAFADDSMRGRESGTRDAQRAAFFLGERLRTLGFTPAGDSGFYQRVPLTRTTVASQSTATVTTPGGASQSLAFGADLTPITSLGAGVPGLKRSADGELLFAQYGITNKKLDRDDFAGLDAKGKVLVMVMGAPDNADSTQRAMYEGVNGFAPRIQRALGMRPAAVVLVFQGRTADLYGMAAGQFLRQVTPRDTARSASEDERPLPPVLLVSERAAKAFVPAGWPARAGAQFAAGTRFAVRTVVTREQVTDYNVVATLRGTDAALASTYVAVGAHLDHIGIQTPVGGDSVANGADDDGSGSVTALAVARAAAQGPRMKRSWLFVFHTGEEKGLLGSAFFTAHPTVPLDSVVAQLNADMVGRNGADSLYVVGPSAAPKNQSVVLGGILDSVNAAMTRPFTFDRSFDSATHPEHIYERSDHFHYAKVGIPIVFFTTGLHADYHKVSDSPEKIGYEKMARVATLLWQTGLAVGNRGTRPR